MEQIKVRIEVLPDGRLRASGLDGQIVVEGNDIAELRRKAELVAEAILGGPARIALWVDEPE